MVVKKCSKCGQEKELIEFNKDKKYKDGYFCWCKGCVSEYEKSKRLNKDYIQRRKEYSQQYYIDNKTKINERNNDLCRNKWKEDPEYRKRKNKQKCDSRKARRENPETREALLLAEKIRATNRRFYLEGDGKPLWDELCKKHDYKCACCKQEKKLTIDHIIPLNKGGTNDINNIQPLCVSCNSRKCNDTTDYRIK